MGEHKALQWPSGVHVYCMRVNRFRPTRVCFGWHMAREMHRLIIEIGLKNVSEQTVGTDIYPFMLTEPPPTLSRAFQRHYPRVTQHKTSANLHLKRGSQGGPPSLEEMK
jgi:hypothetical protein